MSLTEMEGKLVGRGDYTHHQVQLAWGQLAPFVAELPFDADCREKAALYYARRSPYNFSLGDAACLGTAERYGCAVLTAERGWSRIPDLPNPEGDLKRLLEQAPLEMRVLLRLGGVAGLRASEITDLKWGVGRPGAGERCLNGATRQGRQGPAGAAVCRIDQ